ncbi:Glycolipid 2-alpha-mannosyltransferase 1 [Leucoagaricus sp. SymC.cos]|nr:Glycolipid 2-alpha-mannosyltransferase 1 [Leucoagaricus sp. SymC.cos]
MMTAIRYVFLVLVIIISLHYILSFSNEVYGRATSLESLRKKLSGTANDPPYKAGIPDEYYLKDNKTSPQGRKANAAIVILARNSDVHGVASSVKQMEDRFNKKFGYDYVLLNDQPFEDKFKRRIEDLTDSTVKYGLIPKEEWLQPEWIDEEKAKAAREKMVKDNVIYGGACKYRNMCRFNSGWFYRQEVLKPYRYYWRFVIDFITVLVLTLNLCLLNRVEPDIKFFCDIDYDPFVYMEDNNKVYGFTISLYEYETTIPTLWKTVKEFTEKHPELVAEGNAMQFLSDDNGSTYNRCHFWSNFEIGDMEFWRGEAYSKFFDYLDQAGGFYYERWGDAPVHSIGAALLARKEQIHFFNDIGYRHEPFQHCPQGDLHKKGKCWCDSSDNFGAQPAFIFARRLAEPISLLDRLRVVFLRYDKMFA